LYPAPWLRFPFSLGESMKKTLEELKKEYDEQLKALRKKKEEALKKAKARTEKAAAADRLRLRKQETHIKIILGGYMLAELKRTKDKTVLGKVADSLKSDKDKKLIKDLAGTL